MFFQIPAMDNSEIDYIRSVWKLVLADKLHHGVELFVRYGIPLSGALCVIGVTTVDTMRYKSISLQLCRKAELSYRIIANYRMHFSRSS